MNRLVTIALLTVGAGLFLASAHPVLAQSQPLVYTQGVPIRPATLATATQPAKPLVLPFMLYNPTTKKNVPLTATVPVLAAIRPAQKGPPPVPAETPAQASQHKAAAVVAAINAAITAAVTAGTLPAGTPLATIATQPAMVGATNRFGIPLNAFGNPILPNALPGSPFGGPQAMVPNRLAGFAIVTLPGVGLTPAGTLAVGGPGSKDPTGEPMIIGAAGAVPPMPVPPPSTGSMGGGGSKSGLSTGDDGTGTGTPSSVSFGFFDTQGLDAGCNSNPDLTSLPLCPGDFIATVTPAAGEDNQQVPSALADAFNLDFGSLNLSATYDPATDILSIDQPLPFPDTLYVGNTDPGLNFFALVSPVPEPSTFLLLGVGLAGLAIVPLVIKGNSRERVRRRLSLV